MIIGGKQRAVRSSCFPMGFKTQQQWEAHARNQYAHYAWRLLVLDKEIDEREYQHMLIRLFLTMRVRGVKLAITDQNTFR